jgi:hypothetical protein
MALVDCGREMVRGRKKSLCGQMEIHNEQRIATN